MKKTNSIGVVFLVALLVAIAATTILSFFEQLVGAEVAFLIILGSLPFVFIWCMITAEKQEQHRFMEREKQWRNNCDLPHRNVIKKTK